MSLPHDLILVVDAHDRPLAAMPADAVVHQGLLHRRVLALLSHGHGRVLLRSQHAQWQPAAAGMVRATESRDEAVERLLPPELAATDRTLLTILPPSPTIRAFISVFLLRGSIPLADAMALDREELAALIDRYPETVAPELRHAWEAGVLWI